MKKVPFKDRKFEQLLKDQDKVCPVCQIPFYDQVRPALRLLHEEFEQMSYADMVAYLIPQMHHRLPDTDDNIRLLPKFIHSMRNLVILHQKCHMDNKFFMAISFEEGRRINEELANDPVECRYQNEVVL